MLLRLFPLLLCLLASLTPQVMATTIEVPEGNASIGGAMTQASAGDIISVRPRLDGDYHEMVHVNEGVRLEARAGYAAPVIDADGASMAVEFAEGPDTRSAIVGFRIIDFTGVGVSVTASESGQIARIENCTIEGGSSGVDLYGAEAIVVGNAITGQSSVGIHVQHAGGWTIVPKLWDNLVVNAGQTGTGIDLYMNGFVPDVSGNSVVGWSTGIKLQSIGPLTTLQRNLVVGASTKGIDCQNQGPILSNNDSWNNGSGSTADNFCNCGSNPLKFNLSADPLFCNDREGLASTYTLKIESPCSEGNRGYQVGAKDVGCAWGLLPDDVTIAGADHPEVFVLEDLIVPTNTALTVKAGVTLKFDEDDNSGLGDDIQENELTVNGVLRMEGTSGDPVIVTSPTGSEADWYGVVLEGNSSAYLDYAEISKASYGVRADNSVNALEIDDCTFSGNSNYDLHVATDGASRLIRNNALNVGGGTGLYFRFDQESPYVLISGNTLTGSSASTNGMYVTGDVFDQWATGEQVISGNVLSGFTAGTGIRIATSGMPMLYGNQISGSMRGIYAVRPTTADASPYIGWLVGNPNVITGNTTGIRCDSTSVKARIHCNEIAGNQYGVVIYYDAQPQMGVSDQDRGNNNLSGNSDYCIWNRTVGDITPVLARYNYFGPCSGGIPPVCALGLVDVSGGLCTSPVSAAEVPIGELPPAGATKGLVLRAIEPNPCHGSTAILFTTGQNETSVRIQIFDVSGRVIRDLGILPVGTGDHTVSWDGRNGHGLPVQNGIYFVRLRGSGGSQGSSKLLVAR